MLSQTPDSPPPSGDDIAQLRSELDAYRNGAVDRWLELAVSEGRIVRDYENSLSWRITRPLRLARRGFTAVRTIGPVAVAKIVIERRRTPRA